MAFTMDMGALRSELQRMQQRSLHAMEVQAQASAKSLEAQARVGAPWQDRTGAARGGITGRAERRGAVFTITLSGSVHYLVYLELAHGRKWAALWPAMEKNAQRILTSMARAGGFL